MYVFVPLCLYYKDCGKRFLQIQETKQAPDNSLIAQDSRLQIDLQAV